MPLEDRDCDDFPPCGGCYCLPQRGKSRCRSVPLARRLATFCVGKLPTSRQSGPSPGKFLGGAESIRFREFSLA